MGEHGLISDSRSAALAAADGTLEWWCPRRYDASPILTRLLDPAGASVRVGPQAPVRTARGHQSYVDDTFILRTVLTGADSVVEVTDFMPASDTAVTGRIVRRLRVLRGPADVVVSVALGTAEDVSVWGEGMSIDGVVVRCGLPFTRTSTRTSSRTSDVVSAAARLDTGEGLVVTIDPPGLVEDPLSVDGAGRLEERTASYWRRFAARVEIAGKWGPPAARSALVARALSGLSGAPVSSPVTSLPRLIGGERNADGRLARPVDAAAWCSCASALGLWDEADAAAEWMLDALSHEAPLPSALAPDGSVPSSLSTLPMPGYARSQPVVSGIDLGERSSVEPASAVISALARRGAIPHWERVITHTDWIVDHWEDPDASIWALEPRDRRWTSARLAARAALSAAAQSARSRKPLDLDAAGWQLAAQDIERWLLKSGAGPGGVLVAGTGSGLRSATDASLVRVATLGPWPAEDEVVRATVARVEERLGFGPWVHPYSAEIDDGLPGSEPPSVAATLWLAQALAVAGRWDEAHERMEAAVDLAGPLHLLPESVDGTTGKPLGNRPAAGSHIAFINAALALSDAPA